MPTRASFLKGMSVYTDDAILLGRVDDVVVDTDLGTVVALAIGRVREGTISEAVDRKLQEGKRGVTVPYKLVRAIGDIIIIKRIPEFEIVETG